MHSPLTVPDGNIAESAGDDLSLPTMACCLQDGYVEERSALGPVNLTVPGGSSAGSLALPLRLLDGFCLYTEDASGTEEVVGLERLENGASLLWRPSNHLIHHMPQLTAALLVP